MAHDHDWTGARTRYVSSRSTFEVVAKEFKIPASLMRKRAGREGWQRERKEFSHQVDQTVLDEVLDNRVKQLKDWNKDTLVEATRLREAARSFFMRKRADGQWVATTKISAQGLTAAASANMTADKLARLALGTSTENNQNTNTNLPAGVDDFV